MDVLEIKVLVPAERVTAFYRWFADWRDGNPSEDRSSDGSAPVPPVDPEARFLAAVAWWRSLRPRERAVWGLWIEAAPKLITAEVIVTELGLNGPRDIPGILSWSGRKGKRVGFEVNWRFEYDAVSGVPLYGLCAVDDLSAVEYANLIRRARAEAEG